MCVTWLIPNRIWLVHLCDVIPGYDVTHMWYDSFLPGIDSFMRVTWLMFVTWLMCVTWHIPNTKWLVHVCDVTHVCDITETDTLGSCFLSWTRTCSMMSHVTHRTSHITCLKIHFTPRMSRVTWLSWKFVYTWLIQPVPWLIRSVTWLFQHVPWLIRHVTWLIRYVTWLIRCVTWRNQHVPWLIQQVSWLIQCVTWLLWLTLLVTFLELNWNLFYTNRYACHIEYIMSCTHRVMWHVKFHITCKMSHVTCKMSHVTCVIQTGTPVI